MAPTDAISAKLDSIREGIARVEDALNRNYDNVNITRHAMNNGDQKILTEIGLLVDTCRDLVRDLTEIKRVSAIISTIATQAAGGSAAFRFMWPLLVGLAAALLAGGGVYFRMKGP